MTGTPFRRNVTTVSQTTLDKNYFDVESYFLLAALVIALLFISVLRVRVGAAQLPLVVVVTREHVSLLGRLLHKTIWRPIVDPILKQ